MAEKLTIDVAHLSPDRFAEFTRRWREAQEAAFREPRTLANTLEPVPPPSGPSPFLAALRTELGSDWSWTDTGFRIWLVEHQRGLRFEVAFHYPADPYDEEPVEAAKEIARVLLDAVEEGVKGLVAVTCAKDHVPERFVYTFAVVPVTRPR